jgi:hypothetical protein
MLQASVDPGFRALTQVEALEPRNLTLPILLTNFRDIVLLVPLLQHQ